MRIQPWEVGSLPPAEKICSYEELPELINGNSGLKRHAHSLVLAQGVFDILHLGHFQYLQRAAKYGLVIVGVENDDCVRANKGPERPINSLPERMLALAALDNVSLVFGFNDIVQYDDPQAFDRYVARYKFLDIPVAIPDDSNRPQKMRQAAAAEVGMLPIPGHIPNSTTQMLKKVGFSE